MEPITLTRGQKFVGGIKKQGWITNIGQVISKVIKDKTDFDPFVHLAKIFCIFF